MSKAERAYLMSVLLGLAVAALVGWRLFTADDTDCFRKSIEVRISPPAHLLRDCTSDPFPAVRRYIQAQRDRAKTDSKFVPEETDKVEAQSSLLVWIVLVMVGVGFAAFVGVRSVVIIRELTPKPRWNATLIALCVLAAILVALPFVLAQLVGFFHIGDFDTLDQEELRWIIVMGGFLAFPGLVALVAIWGALMSPRAGLRLSGAEFIGKRLRLVVSMLGAALALNVLANGARWQVIAALPGGQLPPKDAILLWGAIYALVLALLYVPVYQRWASETETLISDEVQRQLADDTSLPGTGGYRSAEMSLTRELKAKLGLGGGALASLQGSFAVLAPVIAAAVSSLFA